MQMTFEVQLPRGNPAFIIAVLNHVREHGEGHYKFFYTEEGLLQTEEMHLSLEYKKNGILRFGEKYSWGNRLEDWSKFIAVSTRDNTFLYGEKRIPKMPKTKEDLWELTQQNYTNAMLLGEAKYRYPYHSGTTLTSTSIPVLHGTEMIPALQRAAREGIRVCIGHHTGYIREEGGVGSFQIQSRRNGGQLTITDELHRIEFIRTTRRPYTYLWRKPK